MKSNPMTLEQLVTKLRFAGKAVPSMTRRREGHNYCGWRMNISRGQCLSLNGMAKIICLYTGYFSTL